MAFSDVNRFFKRFRMVHDFMDSFYWLSLREGNQNYFVHWFGLWRRRQHELGFKNSAKDYGAAEFIFILFYDWLGYIFHDLLIFYAFMAIFDVFDEFKSLSVALLS